MESLLKSNLTESVGGGKRPCLKLKLGPKVKRLPYIPKSYQELADFIKEKIPVPEGSQGISLTYFDDEMEAISISDDTDYESFLHFVIDEGIKIPKLILTGDKEPFPSYEDAVSEANRTMCVSWIGDSEMQRPPTGPPRKLSQVPSSNAFDYNSDRSILESQIAELKKEVEMLRAPKIIPNSTEKQEV